MTVIKTNIISTERLCEDSMKEFCANQKEQAADIIICEKEEMLPLTKKKKKSYKKQKYSHICKEEFNEKFNEDKNYPKVYNHCHYTGKYRGDAHSICNLRYRTLKEIPVVFHNGFNDD